MKLTVQSCFYDEQGKLSETHYAHAEFDGEHELPGEGASAIAGRSTEIGMALAQMFKALPGGYSFPSKPEDPEEF